MLLRRNSVQALFNGYYHDDNIAALNSKNPPPRTIEEHVPSKVATGALNSQNTSIAGPNSINTPANVAVGLANADIGNSATNTNINTLHQSMHHNIIAKQQIDNVN